MNNAKGAFIICGLWREGENFATYCRGGSKLFLAYCFGGGDFFLRIILQTFFRESDITCIITVVGAQKAT